MATIRIPNALRSYTSGQSEVAVQGQTVAQAMENLVEQYPPLRPHLFNAHGSLRPFVNLFINEENIRDIKGVETPLLEGDQLVLVPSIAGG